MSETLFLEVFPVTLPATALTAYRLVAEDGADLNAIAPKLAQALRIGLAYPDALPAAAPKKLVRASKKVAPPDSTSTDAPSADVTPPPDAPLADAAPSPDAEASADPLAQVGAWLWLDGHLVTDVPPDPNALFTTIDRIRVADLELYAPLQAIEDALGWQPSPLTVAEFVARGAFDALDLPLRQALNTVGAQLGPNVRLDREARATPWQVDGKPAVSLSISTRLLYDQTLLDYLGAHKPKDVIGMTVTDFTSPSLRGEIVEHQGKLTAKQRKHLLSLTLRPAMRALIEAAPNTEHVFSVKVHHHTYDYIASALGLLVTRDNAARFGLTMRQVDEVQRLKPSARAGLVRSASDVAKAQGLIGSAYTSANLPAAFRRALVQPSIKLADNARRRYNASQIAYEVATHGVYARLLPYHSAPIRVGVMNALAATTDDFMEALRRKLKSDYKFDVTLQRERNIKVLSTPNIDAALKTFDKDPIDLLLVFLPNGVDESILQHIRDGVLARGLPCQLVYEGLFDDPENTPRLILAMLGKTGNLPYVLDEPIEGYDILCGFDCKIDKQLHAAMRVYRADAALLRYALYSDDAPTSDENMIPAACLATLLPLEEYGGKRALIHRPGPFSARELALFQTWSTAANMTFDLVEVYSYHAPRLYALDRKQITSAPLGSVFTLNDRECFYVATHAGPNFLAQPLHLRVLPRIGTPTRTMPPLHIDKALDVLQLLTLMHYGTTNPPRLPVTLHQLEDSMKHIAADAPLAQLAYGVVPFWL
jgi:hypothetical protein